MSSETTVAAVAREGNCLGCGTCGAACRSGAVRIDLDAVCGVYRPIVDESKCTQCGLCLAVCPGREVPIDALAEEFLDAEHRNPSLGNYRRLLLGYACDDQVRYNSASGGLVTALLAYALEKKLISGAIVLGHEADRPLLTRPQIARSREEIVAASGSKYCPSAVNVALREVMEKPDVYAFVGLPCQVHALRKWQHRSPILRERIHYVLGLFCINTNTYLGTEYFLRHKGISPTDVQSIRYRAHGWPGEIEVRTNRQTYRFPGRTAETSPHKQALLASAFHYDFMLPRCMVCCDLTSELADASFADPHVHEIRSKHREGISFSVVRTVAMQELIESARADGCVHVEPFPEETAIRAQNYAYKAAVGGRMAYWESLGRPAPNYGRTYHSTWRQRREARRYRWSLQTHKRSVWPLLQIVQTCRRYSAIHPARLAIRIARRIKRWIMAFARKSPGTTGC